MTKLFTIKWNRQNYNFNDFHIFFIIDISLSKHQSLKFLFKFEMLELIQHLQPFILSQLLWLDARIVKKGKGLICRHNKYQLCNIIVIGFVFYEEYFLDLVTFKQKCMRYIRTIALKIMFVDFLLLHQTSYMIRMKSPKIQIEKTHPFLVIL